MRAAATIPRGDPPESSRPLRTLNTTLCLVNFSGKKITRTDVEIDDAGAWDAGGSRPDLNFTGSLADGDARCERAEIARSPSNGCWCTISLTFADGSTLSFRADQNEARTKQSGVYRESLVNSPENAALEVFRRTGEDRYTHTQAFYVRPSTPPNNAGWMGALLAAKPTVTLDHVTMPGSHDAGMYVKGSEWAITQSLSIGDQLRAGARYFDLRVCKSGGELWTYHGSYYGGKLADILDDVAAFLDGGSKEVVFLKFRSYASGDRADTVALVKSKLTSKLYTATTTPHFARQTLAHLAGSGGRAVAVFTPDYTSLLDPASGIFPYSDYGNEDTGVAIPHTDHHNLGVYDSYAHQSEFAVMKKDQHAKWAAHGGVGKDYLFLYSWTLTGSTDNVLDLDLLSATANPQLPKALQGFARHGTKGRPNIVYIDQVDPYLCKAIVDLNF